MKEKNFEQALSELEKIVEELEKGDLTLDQGIEKFKTGIELANLCNEELEKAEKKISILTDDEKEEPLEIPQE